MGPKRIKRKKVKEGRSFCLSALIGILKKEGIEVRVEGARNVAIDHLCTLDRADKNSLTYYVGTERNALAHLRDNVLICLPGVRPRDSGVTRLETDEPQLAYYILAQSFTLPPPEPFIHPTAVVHRKAVVHPTASIGAYSVLEECLIDAGTILHPHVQVYKGTSIGKGVIVESGSSIGATGQMWAWGRDGRKWILPQLGNTLIMDGCFIGSNVTVARGSLQDTILGKRCRISHGSMIGHNCQFGEETFISNGVAVSGGVSTGKYCFLGTGSRYRSGVALGNHITVGVGAVVVDNFIEDNLVIAGVPAKAVKKEKPGLKLIGVPRKPVSPGRH